MLVCRRKRRAARTGGLAAGEATNVRRHRDSARLRRTRPYRSYPPRHTDTSADAALNARAYSWIDLAHIPPKDNLLWHGLPCAPLSHRHR